MRHKHKRDDKLSHSLIDVCKCGQVRLNYTNAGWERPWLAYTTGRLQDWVERVNDEIGRQQ